MVAFDRAGHGESDGEFFDTTVTRDVEDSVRVLDAVAALPGVDAEDLHLVGMSLGAVVASVVAADRPAGVRSVTMWSTAAVFADEVRGGTLQGRPLDVLDGQGFFDFLGQRLGPALREDARGWDPWARAAGWGGPTLLLHGTEDFVPLACARRYLDDDVLGDRAELVVVEGADHGWAQLPQRDTVVAATVDFTTRHARGGDLSSWRGGGPLTDARACRARARPSRRPCGPGSATALPVDVAASAGPRPAHASSRVSSPRAKRWQRTPAVARPLDGYSDSGVTLADPTCEAPPAASPATVTTTASAASGSTAVIATTRAPGDSLMPAIPAAPRPCGRTRAAENRRAACVRRDEHEVLAPGGQGRGGHDLVLLPGREVLQRDDLDLRAVAEGFGHDALDDAGGRRQCEPGSSGSSTPPRAAARSSAPVRPCRASRTP